MGPTSSLDASNLFLRVAKADRGDGAYTTAKRAQTRSAPQTVTAVLTGEGIEVVTNSKVREVQGPSGQLVTVELDRDGRPTRLDGTHLLVATGRTPNTDRIGLDTAGVKLTPKGHIQVNECLETTAEGVFAVGDRAGSPHFTQHGSCVCL